MKKVIVIHELDHDDDESSVVGVADSLDNAESIIDDFYGKGNYKEISFRDIRESNLQYSKVIEVTYPVGGITRYTLTLEWFVINE
jgi:hypothetical protein